MKFRILLLCLLAGFQNIASTWSAPGLSVTSTTVKAGGRSYAVKVVRASLDTYRVKIGLAKGLVGRTESLAAIAGRYHAVAAINGCFFDAYTSNALKNPHHTLITGGQVVHLGRVGTLLGFLPDGKCLMGRVPMKISGGLDGKFSWPDSWYAYWINRAPESANVITIYTPAWGTATGLKDGVQIVVSNGIVKKINTGSQTIPKDGYVIYFRGTEKKVAKPFKVGRRCDYKIVKSDGSAPGVWGDISEGLACGPRLLTDGQVTVNPTAEGFSSSKILTASAQRSMVGVTRDNVLILATSSGTVRQMADVMKALGAWQAMNLDGGASSGLWANGKILTAPGRNLNNVLMIVK